MHYADILAQYTYPQYPDMEIEHTLIINLFFHLIGAFAALLWLKPGLRAAVRYATILTAFCGLWLLGWMKATESGVEFPSLISVVPVLLYLLGIYMLKCPWRRVFLSLGIYALCSWLDGIIYLFLEHEGADFSVIGSSFVRYIAGYLVVLEVWFVIRIFSRHQQNDTGRCGKILAAAAYILVNDWAYTGIMYLMMNGALPDALGPSLLLHTVLTIMVRLLSFIWVLRYVLRLTWMRSICAPLVEFGVLIAIVCAGLAYEKWNETQPRSSELILSAINSGDPVKLEQCINKGDAVNEPIIWKNPEIGVTFVDYPLIYAAAINEAEMVRTLLNAGADVSMTRNNGDSALHAACIEGNLSIVNQLIQAGSDINMQNHEGFTPLLYAVLGAKNKDTLAIIKALLQAGADVNRPNHEHRTSLHLALDVNQQQSNAPIADMVHLLLENGANPNLRDTKGCTPLHDATLPLNEADYKIFPEVIRLLLTYGADINAVDDAGDSPLLQCARDGFVDGARLLLEHGANPNLRDEQGKSPLDHAVENDHVKIADMLRSRTSPSN